MRKLLVGTQTRVQTKTLQRRKHERRKTTLFLRRNKAQRIFKVEKVFPILMESKSNQNEETPNATRQR